MNHVEIAKQLSGREDIEQRLAGRFYTPEKIADRLAECALRISPAPESLGDPFCGDGRLIVAWLRMAAGTSALRNLRRIVLWDYASSSVRVASQRIQSQLANLTLRRRVSIDAEAGDTFARVPLAEGQIDTIITNPPWELLKPDSRDGLSDSASYRQELRSYAAMLADAFPGAMSTKGKAMTGYGINLARAGAIASAMLARPRGAVALVLPGSIFADQASAPFRREFFKRLGVASIEWYPAEARLFAGVDQPFLTTVARAGEPTSCYTLTRFDKSLTVVEERQVAVSGDRSAPVALNVGGAQEDLLASIAKEHPVLHSLEADMRFGLWLGRELDETRLSESLAPGNGGVPFLKGRHVFPFFIKREEIWHIDPRKRRIPATVREPRVAWRDVSRPTQRRRMHVAVVPDGNVTGNSLGVAFFRYGPRENIRLLMAIMNSLVFELQVRARLATAHVSQGVLRMCTIPLSCFDHPPTRKRLLSLLDRGVPTNHAVAALEVRVARAYGVDREGFSEVVSAFPRITDDEKVGYLRSELWS